MYSGMYLTATSASCRPGKAHVYDPGGPGIETRPLQASTACAHDTCNAPGLSYAAKTSTSTV
eukprot:scaffold65987_cov33-Prasinocladus_malaysianus.AAC.2